MHEADPTAPHHTPTPMKLSPNALVLLLAASLSLVGCDAVTGVQPGEASAYAATDAVTSAQRAAPGQAACPVYDRRSLSMADVAAVTRKGDTVVPQLYFDVFDYYGLDPRRTEVRSTVHTNEGTFEEVATVYIAEANGELHLLSSLQEVVRHPLSGRFEYDYRTVELTADEAEACRRELDAFVGKRQRCQGAACGQPYTGGQLYREYPAYHDESLRTPDVVLDELLREVKARVRWGGISA